MPYFGDPGTNEILISQQSFDRSIVLYGVFNNAGIMATTEIEFGGMTSFVAQMDINALGESTNEAASLSYDPRLNSALFQLQGPFE